MKQSISRTRSTDYNPQITQILSTNYNPQITQIGTDYTDWNGGFIGVACRDVARWEWKAPAFHKYVSSTQIRRTGDEIICPAIVETHGSASPRRKTHNAANIYRGDVARYVSTGADTSRHGRRIYYRGDVARYVSTGADTSRYGRRIYYRGDVARYVSTGADTSRTQTNHANPENLEKIMVQTLTVRTQRDAENRTQMTPIFTSNYNNPCVSASSASSAFQFAVGSTHRCAPTLLYNNYKPIV